MIRRIVFLALALAPLATFAAEGPTLRDVMQARSFAMGGAYRAIGGGTEVVDGNPAAISLRKRYLIELSGAWDPRNPFGFGSIGVLDSVTSPLAAGLSYRLVSYWLPVVAGLGPAVGMLRGHPARRHDHGARLELEAVA